MPLLATFAGASARGLGFQAGAGEIPGLQLISTQTFSSVTTVSFDNVFSDKYVQYKLVIAASAGAANNINLRLRANGTDNNSTNYSRQYIAAGSTTISRARESSQATWNGVGRVENGSECISICEISNPFQTAYTSAAAEYIISASSSPEYVANTFGINVTTSYDGFSLAAGSFTGNSFSGTASIYGYYKG